MNGFQTVKHHASTLKIHIFNEQGKFDREKLESMAKTGNRMERRIAEKTLNKMKGNK